MGRGQRARLHTDVFVGHILDRPAVATELHVNALDGVRVRGRVRVRVRARARVRFD